jgi:heme oxygenase (biliverdin-IX-beta and delta-forming)
MITNRLRTETSHWHEQTEQVAFSAEIMSGTLTPEQYVMLIANNYRLHFMAEQALRKFGIPESLPELDFGKRSRLKMLESDMHSLGLAMPHFSDDENPFELNDEYEALGLMYVLEGSTLGGRVILKTLHKNPAFEGISAFRFYEGHGEETGLYWKKFQEVLLSKAVDEAAENLIVQAANKAFEQVAGIFALRPI